MVSAGLRAVPLRVLTGWVLSLNSGALMVTVKVVLIPPTELLELLCATLLCTTLLCTELESALLSDEALDDDCGTSLAVDDSATEETGAELLFVILEEDAGETEAGTELLSPGLDDDAGLEDAGIDDIDVAAEDDTSAEDATELARTEEVTTLLDADDAGLLSPPLLPPQATKLITMAEINPC